MTVHLFPIIFTLFLVSACKKPVEPNPNQLFEEYKGSVVLVVNQYYYELDAGGLQFFYSPSSEQKIFYDRDEVIQNASTTTGTGFFISNQGEIITNRHVVSPADEDYKDLLIKLKDTFLELFRIEYTAYSDTLEIYKAYWDEHYYQLSEKNKEDLRTLYQSYSDKRNRSEEGYNKLNAINMDEAISTLITVKLGVVYNDTYISDFDDIHKCKLIRVSDDEKVDLALIQTHSKKANVELVRTFNFNDNNPNLELGIKGHHERDIKNPITINDNVYMIGYNKGFSIANTANGIKPQFTSGTISQESDGETILYTIPTLNGSSGSPIIDKWGNLVAVNFAKVRETQSFSYGIPVYRVKQFYED